MLGDASPPTAKAVPVSLRLGHATALTCHRQVIHSRGDASLPSGRGTILLGEALISVILKNCVSWLELYLS